MTDNEIIKALECCIDDDDKCNECPFYADCEAEVIAKHSLDLINRQNAEIERLSDYNANLQTANTELSNEILEIKSEAIKEFTERLKDSLEWRTEPIDGYDIDELVEEMTEEK